MYQGTGKRKSAIARVILRPGKGKIIVNKRKITDYFPSSFLIKKVEEGLFLTDNLKSFDININVTGGGLSGQAEAIQHGIALALLKASEDYKKVLKDAGLITRDSRIKERKKPGLRKARRARQFSKR